MMTGAFLKILNMCLAASWIVLAVMAARLVLYKAPKWIRPVLWGMAGIRLVFPLSIESVFSLIPSAEVVSGDIAQMRVPVVHSGVSVIDETVNPVMAANLAAHPETGVSPLQAVTEAAAVLWIVGMAAMLTYAAASYIIMNMRIRTAVRMEKAGCDYVVFQSEYAKTPFVLGFAAPKIYLPYSLTGETTEYVIRHESAHIARKDHWWKAVGFLLLSVYWFNPLFWLSYVLFCRDIESACDERVIKNLSGELRAAYSQALLDCSASHRRISACPLAFGETNVKSRIREILSYKKPSFWVTAIAAIVCIAVAVCFLTNPRESGTEKAAVPEAQREMVKAAVLEWAEGFVSRNGEQIARLSSEELKNYLSSHEGGELLESFDGGYSFGISSPWPWEDYEVFDFGYENKTAILYYYAMTSDPHVTVWKEMLSYEIADDVAMFTEEKLAYFDQISSMEEFEDAYVAGITGTMMDYAQNGLGEALNQIAMSSGGMLYEELFDASQAAVSLLNLDSAHARVTVEREETPTLLTMTLSFDGSDELYRFSMEKPFQENGIWVPQTYKVGAAGSQPEK